MTDKSSTTADTPDTAAQIAALLDQLEVLIPDYTQPDPAWAGKVRSNARFANELITPTVTAVTNYEPLRQRNLFDVEAGKNALAFRDEYRPLSRRLAVILAAFEYTIDSKLAHSAMEALEAYHWFQRHAGRPDGSGLRPYVGDMQRVVEKTLNHRPKQTAPAPVSQSFMAGVPADDDDVVVKDAEKPEHVKV